MKNTPIVLIHKNNSWYLPYTVWQLKQSNLNAPIYLIGDKKTKLFKKWLHHIDINHFNKDIKQLHSIYKHHSSLGAEFELTCIERWFILLAFMKENHIQKCIYLDSDILVYDNLNKQELYFPTYEMTWCGFSAHSNFINNINALENYCNNIIDCYQGNFPENLKEKSHYHQIISGQLDMNISDMTFFHDYNLRYPDSLIDISLPNKKGTFDRSMEDTRVFERDQTGFKKVYWHNKIPYCKEISSGNLYPFITLHFQGKGKQILKKHFNNSAISFFFYRILNNIMLCLFKIKIFI